jgi:hypothetical protein
MKREKEDMDRLDEALAQHLHREPAPFDFAQWAHRFPEEAKLVQSGFAQSVPNRKTQLIRIGRCLMTSRYTKLAGVAAAVLVALSFLFPGRHGIVPESVAWADVQKAMEQVQTIRVTGTRTCFFSPSETPTYELGLEKLFSFSRGYIDRTFTEDGQLIIELAYDLQTGTVTVLFPTRKLYFRTQAPQALREETRQVTFREFGESLFVSGDYRMIGPNDVQGIQAVGFEVSDLHSRLKAKLGLGGKLVDFFFSFGPACARMWVNPKTRLPIQLEAEGKVNPCLVTGYREMTLREIDDRWEFDVEMDGVQFLPAIPEDYQELTLSPVSKAQAAWCVAGAGFIAPAFLAVRRSRRRRSKTPVTAP